MNKQIFMVLILGIMVLVPLSNATSINSSSIYAQVPIVIKNSQNVSTPAPFQQMIIINATKYAALLNYSGNEANFEFANSNTTNATIIPAWIESENSSKIVAWVRLANGIPANSSITIYLKIATKNGNLLSSSGTSGIGEAPELSPVYAEYDDGASVFPNYWNFNGTSLPSGWTIKGGTVTVNNKLSLNDGGIYYNYSNSSSLYNHIVELYGNFTADSGVNYLGFQTIPWVSGSQAIGWFASNSNDYEIGNWYYGSSGLPVTIYATSSTSVTSPNILGLVSFNSSSSVGYVNYESYSASYGYSTAGSNVKIEIGNEGASPYATGTVYWARIRAYPPNGVMPSVTFSQVQTNETTISISKNNIDYNQSTTLSAICSASSTCDIDYLNGTVITSGIGDISEVFSNYSLVAKNYTFYAENVNTSAKSSNVSLTVNKISPVLNFTSFPSNRPYDGDNASVSVKIISHNNQISGKLYLNTALVDTTDNNTTYINPAKAGTYDYVFNTTGNDNYTSLSINKTLTISQNSSYTFSITGCSSHQYPYSCSAVATISTYNNQLKGNYSLNNVSIGLTNTTLSKSINNTLGTYDFKFVTAGNDNYTNKSTTMDFSITQNDTYMDTLKISPLNFTYNGTSHDVTASVSSSNNQLPNETSKLYAAAGKYEINFTFGNANYTTEDKTVYLNISKAAPVLSLPNFPSDQGYDGKNITISADISSYDNQLNGSLYINSTKEIITAINSTYIIHENDNKTTTYNVVFNTTGDDNYTSVSIKKSFIVFVYAPVSTPSNINEYYPIEVINSQNKSTASPSQQMIEINESKFPDLKYNSSFANFELGFNNETIIPAWIGSNDSGILTVWAKINPPISANSELQINLFIASNSTNLLSSTGTSGIGEAPELSPVYAEYDDGASVFPNYWNFNGTSLPSGWVSDNQPYTVNNSLTLSPASSASCPGYIGYNTTIPIPFIIDSDVNQWSSYKSTSYGEVQLGAGASFRCSFNSWWGIIAEPNSAQWQYQVSSGTDVDITTPSKGVFSEFYTNSVSGFLTNYTSTVSTSVSSVNSTLYIGGQVQNGASGDTVIQWINTRAYPPNGVMPNISFGPLTTASQLDINEIKSEEVYNGTNVPELNFTVKSGAGPYKYNISIFKNSLSVFKTNFSSDNTTEIYKVPKYFGVGNYSVSASLFVNTTSKIGNFTFDIIKAVPNYSAKIIADNKTYLMNSSDDTPSIITNNGNFTFNSKISTYHNQTIPSKIYLLKYVGSSKQYLNGSQAIPPYVPYLTTNNTYKGIIHLPYGKYQLLWNSTGDANYTGFDPSVNITSQALGNLTTIIPLNTNYTGKVHDVSFWSDVPNTSSIFYVNNNLTYAVPSYPVISHFNFTNSDSLYPKGMAITNNGTIMYIADFYTNNVSIVNLNTGTIIKNITGFDSPYSVVLNPNDTEAYVSNVGGDDISVVDLSNDTIIKQISTSPDSPYGMALYVGPTYENDLVNLTQIYIAVSNGTNTGETGIERLDLNNDTLNLKAGYYADSNTGSIAVSSQGGAYILSNKGITVYEIQNDLSYDENINLTSPVGLSALPDGNLLVTESYQTLSLNNSIPINNSVTTVSVSYSGDTPSYKIIKNTYSKYFDSPSQIAISPADTNYTYVDNLNDGTVAKMDTGISNSFYYGLQNASIYDMKMILVNTPTYKVLFNPSHDDNYAIDEVATALNNNNIYAIDGNKTLSVSVLSSNLTKLNVTKKIYGLPANSKLAVSPNGDLAYVLGDYNLTILNLTSSNDTFNTTKIKTITNLDYPTNIAIASNGTYAYLITGNDSEISSVNLVNYTINKNITSLGIETYLGGVGQISYADGNLYATTDLGSTVLKYNLSTGEKTDITGFDNIYAIASSPINHYNFLVNENSSLSIFNNSANKVLLSYYNSNLGDDDKNSVSMAISSNGTYAYITNYSTGYVALYNLGSFGTASSSVSKANVTISKAYPILGMILPSSPVNYTGKSLPDGNASVTTFDAQLGMGNVWANSTNIHNESSFPAFYTKTINNTFIERYYYFDMQEAAGIYNYTLVNNGNNNYYADKLSELFTVNKATPYASLLVNGSKTPPEIDGNVSETVNAINITDVSDQLIWNVKVIEPDNYTYLIGNTTVNKTFNFVAPENGTYKFYITTAGNDNYSAYTSPYIVQNFTGIKSRVKQIPTIDMKITDPSGAFVKNIDVVNQTASITELSPIIISEQITTSNQQLYTSLYEFKLINGKKAFLNGTIINKTNENLVKPAFTFDYYHNQQYNLSLGDYEFVWNSTGNDNYSGFYSTAIINITDDAALTTSTSTVPPVNTTTKTNTTITKTNSTTSVISPSLIAPFSTISGAVINTLRGIFKAISPILNFPVLPGTKELLLLLTGFFNFKVDGILLWLIVLIVVGAAALYGWYKNIKGWYWLLFIDLFLIIVFATLPAAT